MSSWWINGNSGENIAVSDRGLAYGDGLFETVAVRDGACRLLDLHLERFYSSCERLLLPLPAENLLRQAIDHGRGHVNTGSLKIIYTRGSSKPGYALPLDAEPTLVVGITEHPASVSSISGVKVRYCATPIARNPVLAGMKTLNRLEQVLARAEWQDAAIVEGLMLNDRGKVVCGTMSNLFAVIGSRLVTSALTECGIAGIMRRLVLEICDANGIELKFSELSPHELRQADDVFLTNSRFGLLPVAELDQLHYARAELTLQIRRELAARGVEECAG